MECEVPGPKPGSSVCDRGGGVAAFQEVVYGIQAKLSNSNAKQKNFMQVPELKMQSFITFVIQKKILAEVVPESI